MFSNEWLTTLQTCLTGVLAVVIMSLKVKWNAFFTTLYARSVEGYWVQAVLA